ncbi:alpha/beta fold hydrolase [Actinokineospora bangkokensis]|uniref:AB hydrolase-1 domain-containing protein n=1 Tax=Actinokineospora bangkokensis TaxID=1193682 RepID=A0A1Q9LG99_9PSEU|nr:alpha/beta fold hydrolase [Actinokineospora bangkokensis]OLR91068.1 hypothetical protein BJP25_31520 [Actinokineospora bangkokensis]
MRVGRWAWLVPIALVASCTAGPSTRPGIVVNDGEDAGSPGVVRQSGPAPLPELEEPQSTRIRWSACAAEVAATLPQAVAGSAQCARINGVLDSPYLPGQGIARLQLLRVGAGKYPLVVFNDVDGKPGTAYAAELATKLPPAFLEQFFLVGVDRRGTGRSDPVRCVPEEVRAGILQVDPRVPDVEEPLDQARSAGQQCSIALEARLPAIDTWRSAGDAESIRSALGVGKLNAIGHGEGSRVLSVFAERYPDRVGRVVLDGLPDSNTDAKVVLEATARAADDTFAAFAQDCAARACELGDAKTALNQVLDQATSAPAATADGTPLGPGVVLRAVLTGLADKSTWPALSKALADLRSGTPDGITALAAPLLTGTRDQPSTFDATLATRCND